MKVRKAVFPVAGLGTRFLPATKAMPKEMLPIVDKPLIQYAVEEALAAGIQQIIFVTGRSKQAIEDHFDHFCELEQTLMARSKDALLREINHLVPESGTFVYTRQNEPLGLGHAIWCGRHIVGNEPFAVLLADDLVKSDTPVLAQMLARFEELQASMVCVEEVDPAATASYGILDADPPADRLTRVRGLVEKPQPAEAPSNLAIIGRYILTPEIFEILERKETGAGGEIQITDAMARLLDTQPIYGFRYEGVRYDCGNKAGFQMANLSYAFDRDDLRQRLTPFVRQLLEGGD
ncbi:UTP--glucose-1-phosphate uridylyltransferase GalU [Desulfatitalea alkaliphila]|uniref:UTP--glucose-1-phosphate uridylyltransferase n=1 Tax=Desulfatitalea alkaliphila TaxID=2929485 RepID=A0AA41URF6_9BACT|nr:UTP--glucose-1-phosphate uridylyltransferase GalU [Desulfatitalea alkaliphila]MCJ8502318.1 UTP--glucose-1-phosphate uridylyltransferase GalU [Desulfatitalea alkaliphila]